MPSNYILLASLLFVLIITGISVTQILDCKNNETYSENIYKKCPKGFIGSLCTPKKTGLCTDGDSTNSQSILLITFGSGNQKYSNKTAEELNFTTSYTQSFEDQITSDKFALVNKVPVANEWHSGASDYTTDDTDGYMFLVNVGKEDKCIFKYEVHNLCVGLRYEFSAYLANVMKEEHYDGKINIKFRVKETPESKKSKIVEKKTDDISAYENMTWEKYGLSFVAQTGAAELFLDSKHEGKKNYYLAVDDIKLRICSANRSVPALPNFTTGDTVLTPEYRAPIILATALHLKLSISSALNVYESFLQKYFFQLTKLCMLLHFSDIVSYNQPEICPNATWDQTGVTVVNQTVIGKSTPGIFVDTNNTLYVASNDKSRIFIFFENGTNSTHEFVSLSKTSTIFISTNREVYFEKFNTKGEIHKWSQNSSQSTSAKFDDHCYGLFIDTQNTLYCSMYENKKVQKKSLNDDSKKTETITEKLSKPLGISVDTHMYLYVADNNNNRIQLFKPGQKKGTTIAGTGAPNSLELRYPTDVVLDADGDLFIADNGNNRVIRSNEDGYQCVVGCNGNQRSTSSSLIKPYALRFDSHGNLFVADEPNYRVQKFTIKPNSCEHENEEILAATNISTTTIQPTTSPVATTTTSTPTTTTTTITRATTPSTTPIITEITSTSKVSTTTKSETTSAATIQTTRTTEATSSAIATNRNITATATTTTETNSTTTVTITAKTGTTSTTTTTITSTTMTETSSTTTVTTTTTTETTSTTTTTTSTSTVTATTITTTTSTTTATTTTTTEITSTTTETSTTTTETSSTTTLTTATTTGTTSTTTETTTTTTETTSTTTTTTKNTIAIATTTIQTIATTAATMTTGTETTGTTTRTTSKNTTPIVSSNTETISATTGRATTRTATTSGYATGTMKTSAATPAATATTEFISTPKVAATSSITTTLTITTLLIEISSETTTSETPTISIIATPRETITMTKTTPNTETTSATMKVTITTTEGRSVTATPVLTTATATEANLTTATTTIELFTEAIPTEAITNSTSVTIIETGTRRISTTPTESITAAITLTETTAMSIGTTEISTTEALGPTTTAIIIVTTSTIPETTTTTDVTNETVEMAVTMSSTINNGATATTVAITDVVTAVTITTAKKVSTATVTTTTQTTTATSIETTITTATGTGTNVRLTAFVSSNLTTISVAATTIGTSTPTIRRTESNRLTSSTTMPTTKSQQRETQPPFFPTQICNNSQIGVNCNVSNSPCDLLKPCQNNGICERNPTDINCYNCLCSRGFNGSHCDFDHRPCKPQTCLDHGECNETSDSSFLCLCHDGWTGIHCQSRIDNCNHTACENHGVCRSIVLNYTCECLGDSYSGRHCEITSTKIIIFQTISKSFSYIAIIALSIVVMFIVIMDILKYCFGIDPTRDDLERIRQEKRKSRVIQQLFYVHSTAVSPE
ncbi:unnamed protein product [Rotaria socialis]